MNGNRMLNAWLRIDADGTVTIFTGKIELEPETMKWVQAVDKPTHIQVFSTPT